MLSIILCLFYLFFIIMYHVEYDICWINNKKITSYLTFVQSNNICKSHQGFKRYRADTKYSHTMFNLKLWPWPWARPWTNLGTAHRLIMLDICKKLFENPTRDSKDIERTRKCDGRTDGRTSSQMDICWVFLLFKTTQQAKNYPIKD